MTASAERTPFPPSAPSPVAIDDSFRIGGQPWKFKGESKKFSNLLSILDVFSRTLLRICDGVREARPASGDAVRHREQVR
jgi:hypothetical protein